MINRKGFTLVELLAVMVILGLLATIGFYVYNALMPKTEKQYYQSQEQFIRLAAEDYFSTNRDQLPKEIDKSSIVYLRTLITDAYIDEVFDHRQKPCNQDTSYISVSLKEKGKYQYKVHLVCPNYVSK